MSKIFAYLNDESGVSAAECALIIAAAGVAVAAFANLLASPAAAAVNGLATCVRTHAYVATC
jgi:Flp pilus assembly pilin Flp